MYLGDVMNNSKSDNSVVVQALETALAGGKTLTAYELTKVCCEALTKSGQRIPAWTVIRDMIGKGSANDINRLKRTIVLSLVRILISEMNASLNCRRMLLQRFKPSGKGR
jgi:hypothetical protein